jgi:hypothetical protein
METEMEMEMEMEMVDTIDGHGCCLSRPELGSS